MLVIDASALAAWVLPDEAAAPDLDALIARHAEILSPSLLWAEIRNILIVNERRGRLPAGAAEAILAVIEALGVTLDSTPQGPVVLTLARRHRLTVYDALYLELALRRGAALASLDTALVAAARAEGVVIDL